MIKQTWRAMMSVLILACHAKAGGIAPELRKEAEGVVQKGAQWLLEQQQPQGYWSNKDFPALTALPVWALVQAGILDTQAIDRAAAYILSCVHDDGSIWREPAVSQKGGGLANYNTALCMVALQRVGRADLVPVVLKARQFLASAQHQGSDLFSGGMGYDPVTGRPYADLSNSYLAYEAMRLTEDLEDLRKSGDPRVDLDWKAAVQFIQRVQNRPESNDQPWAGDDPDHYGGFAYKPDASQAGTFTNEAGEIRFRSYGSMTYAGLLSFIYADVNRSDPRVTSALDWAMRHWTLDENPGMGRQGLYFFYNVLAKALAVTGREDLKRPDGSPLDWRSDLIRKLLDLRKTDPKTGAVYWVNEENRWWEADPVLVTSYTLLALKAAMKTE